MEKKLKKITCIITIVILVVLFLFLGYVLNRYIVSKEKNDSITEEISTNVTKTEELNKAIDTSIFELAKLREENQSKLVEYEEWIRRNEQVTGKLAR